MSSYRGIRPVVASFNASQPLGRRKPHWTSGGRDMATALFAGQSMAAHTTDGGNTYQLSYMGFMTSTNYRTIAAAKADGADFARAVLLAMLGHVGARDDDHSLRMCLGRSGG